ncbi:SGNH/GDSL hydrolase family protein [Leptolyngbya sp. FACHB-261]|uniref:SGNH/GDSL hydrolase family protein n=1 Tax=Leptolyngbya sp. FACHB-261 TaxID=2692806 RepID=UPI001684E0B7|nr:SGNH/GDSL hydrolase family protein [Leptolyngbya sp. FACHB-261]MBD2099730.1 SGNH/GDSL hydrolase family protein [Leptolyngbya sp. FACHB-261]
MAHIILLGDSIFDNSSYVSGGPAVIEQVQSCLPDAHQATLLAVDGNVTQDVHQQLKRVPANASHLFISVGGNDALRYAYSLHGAASTSVEVFERLAAMKTEFQRNYQQMLKAVLALRKSTTVCTIYDQCPLLDPVMRLLQFTALSMFNDCITREAIQAALPVIDLRIICNEASDYAAVSPIEPSVSGGQKIAQAIATIVTEHDFSRQRSVVYL